MKLNPLRTSQGFTLGEALICVGITSILFAGIFSASVGLNRAYAASNDYFSTHMQQIRIMDYLVRDVKRSFSVSTSPDLTTVTCVIPTYTDSSGVRRTPVLSGRINKAVVDYSTSGGNRSVADMVTTSGSKTLTSATANFTAADVGKPVVGTSLVTGTTIASVTNATTVVLSANATATVAKAALTIGGDVVVYTVTGNTIARSQNGVITTIAASTDSLLPKTTDWQLSNTEFTTTTVTFQPIFTMGGSQAQRDAQRTGTTVYATAYLRNKRRGN